MRTALLATASLGMIMLGCAGPSSQASSRPFAPPDQDARVPYGSQDREDVTGAVSTVSVEESEHLQDVLEMLRGRVAGLQVTELPNGDIRLRIRGAQQSLRTDDASNQPLLVIDGMPVLPTAIGPALRGLVPNQIASINVLKDVSSTAIYGSRGANGVILIHLKR